MLSDKRFRKKEKRLRRARLKRDNKRLNGFYKTRDWAEVRYRVLVLRGAICECCGANAKDGVRIVVDHIKPIRLFWDKRLDINNMQVLCNTCNRGKGYKDQTDWRKCGVSEITGTIMDITEDCQTERLEPAIAHASFAE